MLEIYDQQIAFYLPYFNIPVNWTIASTWIVMIVLMIVSWLATRHLKTGNKVSHWQTAMEVIVKAIYGQINEVTKSNAMTYMPFIGTLFIFILTCNILTIIPEFKTPTASLSTTGALALMVLFGVPFFGIKTAGVKKYLKKYIEPSPAMLPFNILSEITSTGAMAVRLFGNVLSGVIIGSICMILVPFILPLPMQVLGLFTGMIQAYIFAMLALMYVSSVRADEDEEAAASPKKSLDIDETL
ncbi:MAG: F0F1 ATP synthase subunit A [Alphaproteobacteria bacterium]|nr:F0F1 ATP synthase subunit A [Alphaproteobacteria bacterium]MBO4644852.1 F0F1 ATP synthase subunit A [Alphaproteobacteria bacterium]